MDWLAKTLGLRADERRPFVAGFVSFFLVFVAWYMIRPVREAMGIARGAGSLPWLMLGTVIVSLLVNPLYSRLTTRATRTQLARWVYRFLAVNLLAFYLALSVFDEQLGITGEVRVRVGFVMYVWVSIFSLINNSVLWSLVSERFDSDAGRRTFGLFAAACSLGGIVGATITGVMASAGSESGYLGIPMGWLPEDFDTLHVLLMAAGLMWVASWSASKIVDGPEDSENSVEEEPLDGSVWEGLALVKRSPFLLGISGYVLMYTIIGTFVYLMQGAIVDALGEGVDEDIQSFAFLDTLTSVGTLAVQLFGTSIIVRKLGVTFCLGALPLFCAIGLGVLWIWPVYGVLAVFQISRRIINYGLAKPARELLFTSVTRAEKYKAKNLIDLFIYRSGDTIGSLTYAGLRGAGIGGVAIMSVPLSLGWFFLAPFLGREFERREAAAKVEAADGRGSSGEA